MSSRSQGDHTIVTLAGEIDLYTAPRLQTELVAAMRSADTALVVVDMSGVEFCDSTGMNVLLAAHRRACERGGDLRSPRRARAVRKILQVTGLESVFTVPRRPRHADRPVAAVTPWGPRSAPGGSPQATRISPWCRAVTWLSSSPPGTRPTASGDRGRRRRAARRGPRAGRGRRLPRWHRRRGARRQGRPWCGIPATAARPRRWRPARKRSGCWRSRDSRPHPRHLLFLDGDLAETAADAAPLAGPVRAGEADMTIAVFSNRVKEGGHGFVVGAFRRRHRAGDRLAPGPAAQRPALPDQGRVRGRPAAGPGIRRRDRPSPSTCSAGACGCGRSKCRWRTGPPAATGGPSCTGPGSSPTSPARWRCGRWPRAGPRPGAGAQRRRATTHRPGTGTREPGARARSRMSRDAGATARVVRSGAVPGAVLGSAPGPAADAGRGGSGGSRAGRAGLAAIARQHRRDDRYRAGRPVGDGARPARPARPAALGVQPSTCRRTLAIGLAAAGVLAAGTAGLGLCLHAGRRGWPARPGVMLAAGLIAAAAVALVPPFGSSDQLSYAAYGRMVATGHDPYLTTPAMLARLGDPVARAVQDWRHSPSVYGSLATGGQALASLDRRGLRPAHGVRAVPARAGRVRRDRPAAAPAHPRQPGAPAARRAAVDC